MDIASAETYLKSKLAVIYKEQEATNIAAIVLEEVCSISRTERLLNNKRELTAEQKDKLEFYAHELSAHKPLQYVLHKAWFYGMELYVDESVLIPRPETEELVQWIVADVKRRGLDVFDRRPGKSDQTTLLKILDIGCGSGCISLALKKEMPAAELWGCDVSDDALNVARRNGASLDLRVDFQGLDILDPAQQMQLPMVDIIVSNPPYIPITEKRTLDANVVHYEPHLALFVPYKDPLLFYKAIARFAEGHLHPGGYMYFEIHEDMGSVVLELFASAGFADIVLKKDMQGKDRMVRVGKRINNEPRTGGTGKGIMNVE